MRVVKIVSAAVAALVLLLVIGAAIVAALFDPNDYKGVVTDAFQARTGRTLTIDRDLKLDFFPWLAVETGGITIGEAAGFGGAGDAGRPFATVQRAAARVKLLPLLEKRIEIGTVELDGLTLNLERDAEQRGNWEDLGRALGGSADGAPADTASSARNGGFALAGIEIRDGAIYWRENKGELRYTVSHLDFTTGNVGPDKPLDVNLAFDFRDERSQLGVKAQGSATVEVGGHGVVNARNLSADLQVTQSGAAARDVAVHLANLAFDREVQTLRVENLTTDTGGLQAAWNVNGSALLTSPALTGSVSVPETKLAEVLDAFGLSAPDGVTASDLGKASFAADFAFRADPQQVRLTQVKADLLGMRATGEGTLDGSDELEGRVDIPEFTTGKALQALLRTAVPPTVDVSALDKLALTTSFDANLTTGRAALRGLKAIALGATVQGELEAIPGRSGNTFRGSVETSRFAPDAFAKAFARLLSTSLAPSELGTMQLKTRFAFDSGADTVTADPFEAELFGIKASGQIQGRRVTRAASWTGQVKVAQFSPQALMQRFGLPPQPTSDPKALTRATVDAKFEVDANSGRLRDIVLALDDSRITGSFTVDDFENPKYLFGLNVDRVDADRYLPPKADEARAGQKTAGDIELPEHNTMRLDGTMQVGDLALAGLKFSNVGSRIVIGNGDMTLENARAHLYGGDFAGTFGVRARGNQPGLELDGKATKLDLAPLIEALTGEPANFSGSGDFQITLSGTGRKIIDNVRTAGGNVSFAMSDGVVKGFNLGSLLCAAYNLKERLPAPTGQPKETKYQVIKGTATVTAGTAKSKDLLARTAFMDISGGGTLGLVEQRLDYDVDAKLTGKIAIPGCQTMDGLIGESIPFNIKGTVTDPSITPDFSKILQKRLRDEAQDRLREKLLKSLIR
jgi:AsmA protein